MGELRTYRRIKSSNTVSLRLPLRVTPHTFAHMHLKTYASAGCELARYKVTCMRSAKYQLSFHKDAHMQTHTPDLLGSPQDANFDVPV
jgi:hypothetical protein